MSDFDFSRAEHEAALAKMKDDFDIKTIDYTRALEEYPTIDDIASFISKGIKPKHNYTHELNINGVLVQDKMENYLADEGLSSSMLKAALKTPLDFHFAKSEDKELLDKIRKEAGKTSYLDIGTRLHQYLLEPSKFNKAILDPGYALNTTEGCNNAISFWENTIISSGYGIVNGETVISSEALDYCFRLVTENLQLSIDKIDGKRAYIAALKNCTDVDSVTEEDLIKIKILEKHINAYGDGIIYRLLKHSKREISCYYTEPSSGLRLKVRPDSLQFESNIGVNAVISVKSTSKDSLDAFFSHAAKLDYDLSEGMYQEVVSGATGIDFNTTIMIVLQTVAPYHVAVLVWSAEDIETGKYKYRTALQDAFTIIENNSHKGYDSFSEQGHLGLISTNLPLWNQKNINPKNI